MELTTRIPNNADEGVVHFIKRVPHISINFRCISDADKYFSKLLFEFRTNIESSNFFFMNLQKSSISEEDGLKFSKECDPTRLIIFSFPSRCETTLATFL